MLQKKNTRKLYVLLLISIFLISGCSNDVNQIEGIEIKNVEKHLGFLTSEELEGRLIGSDGNWEAINYIEGYFQEIGLIPLEQGGYRQEFNTIQPEVNTSYLRVVDQSGNVIKTYEHMTDFRVPLDGLSVGGSFAGEMIYLTNYHDLNIIDGGYKNLAVLVDYDDEDFNFLKKTANEIDDKLLLKQSAVVIYPDRTPNNEHGLWLGSKLMFLPERGLLKLAVTESVYNELQEFSQQGYHIEVENNIAFNPTTGSNVLGIIPGSSKQYEKNLILATSIDGFGKDGKENIYPSATNNAASLALMLELARFMTENEVDLDATIIFMAYDGKHIGEVGLQSYFLEPLTLNYHTEVILLDQLGNGNEDSLIIATYQNPDADRKRSLTMVNRVGLLGEELDIGVEKQSKYYTPGLIEFRKRGIPTIVVTSENSEMNNLYNDTLDRVNYNELYLAGEIILSYVENYGNVNLRTEINVMFKNGWWGILLLLLLTSFKVYFLKFQKESKNPIVIKIIKYPVITTILILTLFYMMLSLHIWYIEMDYQGVAEGQVNITIPLIGHHLIMNILAMLVLALYTSVNFMYFGIVAVLMRQFFNEINNKIYLIILSFTGAISYYISFNYMYYPPTDPLIPNILSPNNVVLIMPIIFAVIACLIVGVYIKEEEVRIGKEPSKIHILIGYTGLLFIMVLFAYAPYFTAKEFTTLRGFGRGPFF